MSSQETDTLTGYYEPQRARLTDRRYFGYCYFVFLLFPRGFPCGVPNSIRLSGGLFHRSFPYHPEGRRKTDPYGLRRRDLVSQK